MRQNDRPAKRVSLRLGVKAGSLNEADDQLGLAHLIEHMAFNGSTHFKPGELVKYFETVGRAPRPARQRLHELRRDGLHVRRAERQAGNRRKGADRARRLRRRPVAVAAGSRQGTRRRGRGVARRARRRFADPRQAVSDSLLSLAVRGSAADWQAGHHPQRAGGAAARVLRHLVSPRSHGRDCGRRHRRGEDRAVDPDDVLADQGAGGRGQAAGPEGAAAQRAAGRGHDRSGGDAVDGLDRTETAAGERAPRGRLPPPADRAHGRTDDGRAARRHGAESRTPSSSAPA